MPTISVAMIVKNEAVCIERCLESVSRFADEIVVVDTGSTDDTMALARQFTDKVFVSEMFDKDTHYSEFRFGVARNESIKKCTGDWIVWWDADDVISADGAKRILEIADTQPLDRVFDFRVKYGKLLFQHCRMFPNGQDVLFDENHSCHEYLLPGHLLRVQRHDVEIEHCPIEREVSSARRNLAILEKDYFERGMKDQRTLFYLANTYRELGEWEKACEIYEKYLDASSWKEERMFARYYRAHCFRALKKWTEARNECYKAVMEDERFAEPYCLLGDLYYERKSFVFALSFYQMAKSMNVPADAVLFTSTSYYDDYPAKQEAKCRTALGIKTISVNASDLPHLGDCIAEAVKDPGKPRKVYVKALETFSENLILTGVVNEYVQRSSNVEVGILVDEVQKALFADMRQVFVAEEQSESLIEVRHPTDLKGKHMTEWYARSMGFILSGPVRPFVGMNVRKEFLREEMYDLKHSDSDESPLVLVQIASDIHDFGWPKENWEKVISHLNSEGCRVEQLDDDSLRLAEVVGVACDVGVAKEKVMDASLVIGVGGWAIQMAAGLGRPVIALWPNEGSLKTYGYEEHANFLSAESDNALNIDVECVIAEVNRVLGIGWSTS
jgi:glycosyltransferase involved in cell wall biosynthesis